MQNENVNNSSKKAYNYCLSIEGPGTELVMGTVTKQFSDHWSGKPKGELRQYMFAEEGERPEVANDVEVSAPWHELDDLAHANGPFTNQAELTVYLEGERIIKLQRLNELTELLNVVTRKRFRSSTARNDTGVIKMANRSDHELDFVIETDKPFDPGLLKIEQDKIDGVAIIDTVSYDGNVLEWQQWGTFFGEESVALLPRKVA